MSWLRLDLVKILVLALPTLVINQLLLGTAAPFADAPGRAALLLLPLVAACAVLWRSFRQESPATLGWAFVLFFPAYCLLFSLATASDLLTGKRILLAAYEEEAPRSFLGLNRLSDWHYWMAPDAPPVDDLLVITFPSFAGEHRTEVRRYFAFLIREGIEHGAKGLAFDYFPEAPADPPSTDSLLGQMLKRADDAGMPVLFGYRQREVKGRLEPVPLASTLTEFLPPERQGHLAGYQEADGKVRMVPLELPGRGELESLSFKVAELLHGGELQLPDNRLMQYTRPRFAVPIHPFSPQIDRALLRQRFAFVGTASETDRVSTPYGEVQGVEIHTWAAHGLRSGHFIRRIDSRFGFPLVFMLCYFLTVAYARGVGNRRLIGLAVVLSGLLLAATVLAMRGALVWVDISYPLIAIWLLIAILLGWRAFLARQAALAEARPGTLSPAARVEGPPVGGEKDPGRPGTPRIPVGSQPEAVSAATTADGFDVFLSHNSRDKAHVKELGLELRERGLEPWLDVWELVPGRSWQDGLEEVIRTVKSSAVLVGGDGLGPWEIPELRACLSEGVRRGLPVIPVLLPGAPMQPVLPLFLTQFTWVDLRRGFTPGALDRLQWGITGIKPPGLHRSR